jgi:peroxiredoxin
VDLQNSKEFQALNVALLSIAFDAPDEMMPAKESLGIEVPMLTDSDHRVSQAYGVLQWAVATGEPGHTFVLVSRQGDVSWIQDYGAAENRGVMYVDPGEIAAEVGQRIESP